MYAISKSFIQGKVIAAMYRLATTDPSHVQVYVAKTARGFGPHTGTVYRIVLQEGASIKENLGWHT